MQSALMAQDADRMAKLEVAQINAQGDIAQEQIKQAGTNQRLAAQIAADNLAQNKSIIAEAASKDADEEAERMEEGREVIRSMVRDGVSIAPVVAQNQPSTLEISG